MSATDRENRLLVAENWTKIYQSYRNADFQSYDFENLRRTMVNYLRQNYPEDFNDYIESSEYLALIDLIAFLGQNIAFRVDLNSRENFLELAERRDSILRLARLISYNAKRNIAASGLLKITSIQTTESIIDSDGRQLSNQNVSWNDAANPNWRDQFIRIMNAALPSSQQYGNAVDQATIDGIPTFQYRFQTANSDIPVYAFTKTISGTTMNFEITSSTFKNESFIYEEAPRVGNRLACLYRDDGHGAGSSSTGFFMHFTQGSLNTGTFTVNQPSSNESIDIDTNNINNSDVWLYQLGMNGIESTQWAKVPSLNGNNVIYNSLSKSIKNIFGVTTRAGDAISLTFGDGVFGNLPQGTFRVYYRISNGLSYTINTQDIKNVTVDIPYISASGQNNTLTITLGLSNSVTNAATTESNTSIKTNAPQNYYTQNRMISPEDYNICPLTVNQKVLKVKAVNRSSSGISRYMDLKDPSSKYSATTLFSTDGILYKENFTAISQAKVSTDSDITGIISNNVANLLKNDNLRNFYYENFRRHTYNIGIRTAVWNGLSFDNATTEEIYLTPGALIKFVAPVGKYFNTKNSNALVTGSANSEGSSYFIWAEIVNKIGSTYIFNVTVPVTSIIESIVPKFTNVITDNSVILVISANMVAKRQFGLRYDIETCTWKIITSTNIAASGQFSLEFQGDTSNLYLDSSWVLLFTSSDYGYVIKVRETRYIFESDKEIRFYFDGSYKLYDSNSAKVITDTITVLGNNYNPVVVSPYTTAINGSNILTVGNGIGIAIGMVVTGTNIPANTIVTKIENRNNEVLLTINTTTTGYISHDISFSYGGVASYNSDIKWKIVSEYIGVDGYIDTKKVVVSFTDDNSNNVSDDPDLFNKIIDLNNPTYIVEGKYNISNSQEDYRYIDNSNNIVEIMPSESFNRASYPLGQYFYFTDSNTMKQLISLTSPLVATADYRVYVGRDGLKFKYIHAADYDSRIDPGLSNLIDIYVLMSDYDIAFRQWVNGTLTYKPLPPSTNEIYNTLSSSLNLIKTLSDEIIYHPVSYTVLFGELADPELQATFKVVKNPEQVISDNEVQSRVLAAITGFFDISNWDFGDTFYFTELSAYVINQLAPYIISFVIVPTQAGSYFGSLFEITANNNQLFINGATVNNIEIITGITTENIKSVSGTSISNASFQQVTTSSPYGSL